MMKKINSPRFWHSQRPLAFENHAWRTFANYVLTNWGTFVRYFILNTFEQSHTNDTST